MKSVMIFALLLAATFLGVVCASEAPRFDTSTVSTAQASTQSVVQQLPPHRRDLFKAAVIKLAAVGGPVPYRLPDGTERVGFPPDRINGVLHGKTAEEIIALAERTPSPVDSVEFRDPN